MLSWLFGPQCAACGASDDAPLCEGCRASLAENGPAACPRCAAPTGELAIQCRRCVRDPLAIDQVIAPWRFGGQLASAIRRLKFTGATHVARTLAPLWAPVLAAAARGAIVVPVPLHWRRRLRRGFDHTWLLALHACAEARLPRPVPLLRRIRHAPAQSTLPASARPANVRGAFVARGEVPAEVVLVDDVVTTGSTLAAAASALYDAGARHVIGVAIARAD
jgi:ComF family protein